VECPRGDVEFQLVPRFTLPGDDAASGGLVAQMPGRVIEVRVSVGDIVTAGQTLILLEAMKMEHPMRAQTDGHVAEIRVAAGEHVENGAVLLVIEPNDSGAETTDETSKAPSTKPKTPKTPKTK
jgi:propionyl-CoA carboxylase alpha chain